MYFCLTGWSSILIYINSFQLIAIYLIKHEVIFQYVLINWNGTSLCYFAFAQTIGTHCSSYINYKCISNSTGLLCLIISFIYLLKVT